MAFDEGLAERIRDVLEDQEGVVEKKMFGGLCFMVHGNMAGGIVGDEIMVRVGPKVHEKCLAEPHARPMDFTGRSLKGMVYVGAEGFANKRALKKWMGRGVDFATSLPPK